MKADYRSSIFALLRYCGRVVMASRLGPDQSVMGNLASSNLVSASFFLLVCLSTPSTNFENVLDRPLIRSSSRQPEGRCTLIMSHNDPSPKQPRKQSGSLRLDSIGVDPDQIVGKVLVHIRRSPTHPAVTLHFADKTIYQVRVDGYNPVHRGIPKELEMNSVLLPLFKPPGGQIDVHLTVTHARTVQLKDTAHEWSEKAESRWNVEHVALALKFAEVPGWHCVWATMAEYDGDFGPCTFRSFDDVYLAELNPSPRKRKSPRKHRRTPRGAGPVYP